MTVIIMIVIDSSNCYTFIHLRAILTLTGMIVVMIDHSIDNVMITNIRDNNSCHDSKMIVVRITLTMMTMLTIMTMMVVVVVVFSSCVCYQAYI